MDTIALVDEQITDGERLLNRLAQEGVPFRAAGWVKPVDEDRWSLYIVTPLVDEKGPLGAYRDVLRHLHSLGNLCVTVSDVKLIGEKQPVAKDLLEMTRRGPGSRATRSRRPLLGGIPVDEVYVYPPVEHLLNNFDEISNPANDPILLNLKRIALQGGERGPFYDQGVLAVIRQIETVGHFTPNKKFGLLLLMSLQQKTNSRLLTDDEVAEVQRFLTERGWTLEQGLEYVDGVDLAERLLFHLKRRDGL